MSRSSRYDGQPSRLAILGELWLGPNPEMGSCFRDRAELVAAWEKYGPEAMAMWARGGRRPQGWWEFEAPPDLHRTYATERSTLYERGLLGIDEAAQLEAEWRRGFDQAQKFSTDAEREEHYREIDLPASLRRRWSAAARRRRAKAAAEGVSQRSVAIPPATPAEGAATK